MEPTETTVPVCYRHPDRITGLSCSRCGRPICSECSNDASVGQLCPECAAPSDRHQIIRGRQIYGKPSFQSAPVSFSIMAVTVAIYILGLVSADLDSLLFQNLAQANWLVGAGEWWRIFTAALLHGSWMHIGFNMYALYLFGPRMEQQVGSPAFAALYVAAAGTGGLASYLFGSTDQVSIGASGAIFGLFGAWIFVAWKIRHTPGGRSMFTQLFVLLAINIVISLAPGIDGLAHLGGFVAGIGIAGLWSILAVGKANAVGIRTAIAVAVIALDLAAVLFL
ncbi:MAG: rhomboid family intramembrane serine protease [Actinomycetota bacterium]|nr:rhomboid family intramembrane serine protease [Actinomycetota bacterium]